MKIKCNPVFQMLRWLTIRHTENRFKTTDCKCINWILEFRTPQSLGSPAVEGMASCQWQETVFFLPVLFKSSGGFSSLILTFVRIGIKDSSLFTRLERFLLLQGSWSNITGAPNLSLPGDLLHGFVEKLKLWWLHTVIIMSHAPASPHSAITLP